MMKILVEDKPRNCGVCLFCKRLDIKSIGDINLSALKTYKCSLLDVEIMSPSKVRVTDCPLKELEA